MLYADLRAALTPHNQLTTIAPGTLTSNVDALLRSVTSGAALVIQSAAFGPGDDVDEQVVVVGTIGLFSVPNLPATLRAHLDADGNAQFTLTGDVITTSGSATTWTFAQSFPDLPQVIDWSIPSFTQYLTGLLDHLNLTTAAFVVSTAATTDAETQAPLQTGANFLGYMKPSGAVATTLAIFDGPLDPVLIHGTINVPNATAVTLPLAPGHWPWQGSTQPPGICLEANLGSSHSVGAATLEAIGMRFYTPIDATWLVANPTYQPLFAYTATLSVPSADLRADVTAPTELGTDKTVVIANLEGFSLAALAGLADALGPSNLTSALPAQLTSGSGGLGSLQLTQLCLALSADTSQPPITWAAATIGMPDLNWPVWPGTFQIDSINVRFEVTSPFASPSLDLTVYGSVEVDSVLVDILASSSQGFTVYAWMDGSHAISLDQLLSAYAPAITPPAPLTVDQLQVAIAPGRFYSLAAGVAESHPWTIPLGPGPNVEISDVVVNMTVPTSGATTGSVGGTLQLPTVGQLSVRYDVPGAITLLGYVDEVKLSTLIAALSDQSNALPAGFDLDLTQSSVLVEVGSQTSVFQLGTQVSGVGSLAFQAQQMAGQWGFAVGFDLTGDLGSMAGLAALGPFQSLFDLDELLVVASSFNAPGFAFPSLAAFNNPNIASKSITLPSQAPGLVAGLNVYGRWNLNTSNREQLLLQRLLGLHPTVAVTLQVSENPSADSKLFVSCNTSINGLPLSCEIGGLVQNGDIGLFLLGHLQASIQGNVQTFDVTMVFVENGAFISGSMTGPTTVDFGSFRLGNLAVEIGTDWEGIPSLGVAATIDTDRFEASVAVFFDSAEPSKSLVAGSVSSLSLADILAVFAPSLPVTPLNDILTEIKLVGTGAFTIPGTVATALDNADIAAVSAAFATQHVRLASSISQVLLVRPDKPAGTWYLTDMTATDSRSGIRHYELHTQSDGTIQVELSPQFYFAPQTTRIGTITYPNDFFVGAGVDLFGWQASLSVNVVTGLGIAVDASLDPIVLGGGGLLSLTGYQGVGGPKLSLATYSQPEQSVPEFRPPHFFASGDLKFLGLDLADFYIDITSQGFIFDISGTLLPLLTFDLHGHFSGASDFEAGGTITAGFSKVPLNLGLDSGPVSLDTQAVAAVDITYDGTTIVATCSFTFTFQGQNLSVAQFELDVSTGPLANLWETIKDQIENRLLHADISLHVDNTVLSHSDDTIRNHLDQNAGQHQDENHSWGGHLDNPPAHNDNHQTDQHFDGPTTHQDQGYHVDQGREVKT